MKGLHKHWERRKEKLKNWKKKFGLKKENKKPKEKGRIKEINMQRDKEILRST